VNLCVFGGRNLLPAVVLSGTTSFLVSNWTKRHIDVLWKLRSRGAAVVFPPCNTEQFEVLYLSHRKLSFILLSNACTPAQKLLLGQRTRDVVSVGQFRPEKDHPKQLLALASLLQRGPAYSDVHLVLVGGARDAGDLQRVADLRSLAKSLKIEVRQWTHSVGRCSLRTFD
jgi:alpha-1,2-mannosyltransferase